jgi:hypothetical protein
LYQLADDAVRGDHTTAAWLHERGGRGTVFGSGALLFTLGSACNAMALWHAGHAVMAAILAVSTMLPLLYLRWWAGEAEPSKENDFARIHFLMRATAVAFTLFIAFQLLRGGI